VSHITTHLSSSAYKECVCRVQDYKVQSVT